MTRVQEVRVFSPATVANVACAFDVLGFALSGVGDRISVCRTKQTGVNITSIVSPFGTIPVDPEKNTASVSVRALLAAVQADFGVEIEIEKMMPVGSGLGSSAASAAGAVCAVNQLLDVPLARKDLIRFAMEGEKAASGVMHADNVAPALLGGVTLVRQTDPLDVIGIPFPNELVAAVVCPQIEVRTEDARKILKKQIPLTLAVEQFGNIAGLVAGLCLGNVPLIGRSLKDVIIEPERAILIPAFQAVKNAAIEAGALGCSISGSGPSIFALCAGIEIAQSALLAMERIFKTASLETFSLVSPINASGCVIEEGT